MLIYIIITIIIFELTILTNCYANKQITCKQIFNNNLFDYPHDLTFNIAGEINYFDPLNVFPKINNPNEHWVEFRKTIKTLLNRFKKKYKLECNYCDTTINLKFKHKYSEVYEIYYGTLISFENNYTTIEILNSIYSKKIVEDGKEKYIYFKTYICRIDGYIEFESPEELTHKQYNYIILLIENAKLKYKLNNPKKK